MGASSSSNSNPSLTVKSTDALTEHKQEPFSRPDPASDDLLPQSKSNIEFRRLDYSDDLQVRALCEMWSDGMYSSKPIEITEIPIYGYFMKQLSKTNESTGAFRERRTLMSI